MSNGSLSSVDLADLEQLKRLHPYVEVARREIEKGTIQLEEHGIYVGTWVATPEGSFFLAIREKEPVVELSETSICIVLLPNKESEKKIAELAKSLGLEKLDDYHITLAFLGKIADQTKENSERDLRATLETLHESGRFRMKAGSVSCFKPTEQSDNKWPFKIDWDLDKFKDFRRELVEELEKDGWSVSKTFEYHPHTTLGYFDEEIPKRDIDFTCLFDRIAIWWGKSQTEVQLSEEVDLSHYDKSTIEDSLDPDDWILTWADGNEDPVNVDLDIKSGRIRNWEKIKEKIKREATGHSVDAAEEVHLREVQVHEYTREDGTKVAAHRYWSGRIRRFVGVAKTKEHAPRPKKLKPEDPDPPRSSEWHLYETPPSVDPKTKRRIPAQTMMVHPKTGETAPMGTTTEVPFDQKGGRKQGYYSTAQGIAKPLYDPSERWEKKIQEVSAMIKAEKQLSTRVQADLESENWTVDKGCALVTILMNRHVFRVGGEGASSNVTKGNREATYVDTHGATTLTRDQVHVAGTDVFFSFTGKSAKEWRVIETDPQIAKMLRDRVDQAKPGERLFGVTDDDVRRYLQPYGFTPHRFRTYWASYIFYAKISKACKNGPVTDPKQQDAIIKDAVKEAANKLNDTDKATEQNYIIPSLMDEFREKGKINSNLGLHEFHLSEQSFGYWLPWEKHFQSWIMDYAEFDQTDFPKGEGETHYQTDLSEDLERRFDEWANNNSPIKEHRQILQQKWENDKDFRSHVARMLIQRRKEENEQHARHLIETQKGEGSAHKGGHYNRGASQKQLEFEEIARDIAKRYNHLEQEDDPDSYGYGWILPDGTFVSNDFGNSGRGSEGTHMALVHEIAEETDRSAPDFDTVLQKWGWVRTTWDDNPRIGHKDDYSVQNKEDKFWLHLGKKPTIDQIVTVERMFGKNIKWEYHPKGATPKQGVGTSSARNPDSNAVSQIAKIRSDPAFLAEVYLSEIWLSPWPELQPGDHWITMKPHGPDSDDYKHVIIREHPNGTAHVVWAGDKGLEHLKLTRHGMDREKFTQAEDAQRRSSRTLSPEEQAQQQQARQERAGAVDKEQEGLGKQIAQILGIKEDDVAPQEIAKALLKKELKIVEPPVEKSPEERELEEAQHQERVQRILNGDLPDVRPGPGPSDKVPPERALAEASVMDLTGELPHQINTGNSVLADAWAEKRQDPEAMKQIAALKALYDERVHSINKSSGVKGRGSVRVVERMGFYDDPGEAETALLSQAREKTHYALNSRFWHLNSGGKVRGEGGKEEDEPGLGAGANEFYYQGITDALGSLGNKYALGKKVNPGTVQMLGGEVVAAALAADIISRGEPSRQRALEGITSFMASDKSIGTVADALAVAEEVDAERDRIRQESHASMLTDAARVNALKNQTVRKQKALARAAGSLETAAGVADFLRKGTGDGIDIKPGEQIDAVRARLEKAGLTEGDGYELRYGSGNELGIHISTENLPRLLETARLMTADDDEIKKIKNHDTVPDDFNVPGLKPGIKLKPEQIAPIQMFEKEHQLYGNIGVGIGKTITFGSAAARLISQGKAKRGWYVVPTNLISSTMNELRDKFPGLKIDAAHGDFNPDIKSKEDRHGVYEKGDYQILLIGQDTIRNDASQLANICKNGGDSAPGFIFGDEVHAMFSPGESADPKTQSGRARALNDLRAPYMFAATGTPIRRSAAEVWKVLNWLRPGQYGSVSSWVLRYSKIGQGVSAFDGAVNQSFQQEINDSTITETGHPDVDFKETVAPIELSSAQQSKYRKVQEDYDKAKLRPGADIRKLVTRKIADQREAIYGGESKDNAMLQHLVDRVHKYREDGEARGLIHCTSIKAVKSIRDAFKPGEILTYTGEEAATKRASILTALNDGALITGVRAKTLDGSTEGVVTHVNDSKVTIKTDSGKTKTFNQGDVTSAMVGIAGTSFATGVISTGLNAQNGSNWTEHYQLADYGSTHVQRNARNYRTGQKRNVQSEVLVPQTPAAREHWQRLQEQIKLNQAFDDPEDYDEHDLFPKEQDVDPTQEAQLAEKHGRYIHHGFPILPEPLCLDLPKVPSENKGVHRRVKLRDLTATQEAVNKKKVDEYREDLDEDGRVKTHGAKVVKHHDLYLIYSGHHRLTAAKHNGQEDAKVHFFDLDKKEAKLAEQKGILYLIRHGKTALDSEPGKPTDIVTGWRNVPVTAEGKKIANETGEALKDAGIEKIVCSDLQRAVQTAKIVCEHVGCEDIEPTRGLRPWNLGDFEGQDSKSVAEKLKPYIEDPTKKVPGGESKDEYVERYFGDDGIDLALKHVDQGKIVALVTHSWNCRTFHAWIQAGSKPDHTLDEKVFDEDAQPTGSFSIIERGPKGEWTFKLPREQPAVKEHDKE
jgi:broad specificity phosphatase PhoE/2'-5' RNA ligase